MRSRVTSFVMILIVLFFVFGCDFGSNTESSTVATTVATTTNSTIKTTTSSSEVTTEQSTVDSTNITGVVIDETREELELKLEEFLANTSTSQSVSVQLIEDFSVMVDSTYDYQSYSSLIMEYDVVKSYLYVDINMEEILPRTTTLINNVGDSLIQQELDGGVVYQTYLGEDLSVSNIRDIFGSLVHVEDLSVYIPTFATATKTDDLHYQMVFSIRQLMENDPMKLATFGLAEPLSNDTDYYITIVVEFDEDYESIHYNLVPEGYPFMEYNEDIFLFYSNYNLMISVKDDIEERSFDDAPFYFSLFDNPNHCVKTHVADETILAYLEEDQESYLKFYLEPGFYNLDAMDLMILPTDHVTWYDESMNPLSYRHDFKIEVAGVYYLEINSEDLSGLRLPIVVSKYSEEEVGTIEEPNISSNHLAGTIVEGNSTEQFFLIAGASKSGYVKLSFTNIDNYITCLINGINMSFDNNTEQYMLVSEGELVFLTIGFDYNDATYDIVWEFVPYDDFETEFADMPELQIGHNIIGIGNPNYEANYRLTITEAGTYSFDDFHSYIREGNVISSRYALYTEDGTMVANEDQLRSTYLDVGNYYLHVYCYEIDIDIVLTFDIILE